MAECARLHVRYEVPDEKGETRRQRNAKFGFESPDIHVPDAGFHVWDWFWRLSSRRGAGPEPLGFSDVQAWQQLTGITVRPEEVEMLMTMDDAFLAEVREEQHMRALRAQEGAKVKR